MTDNDSETHSAAEDTHLDLNDEAVSLLGELLGLVADNRGVLVGVERLTGPQLEQAKEQGRIVQSPDGSGFAYMPDVKFSTQEASVADGSVTAAGAGKFVMQEADAAKTAQLAAGVVVKTLDFVANACQGSQVVMLVVGRLMRDAVDQSFLLHEGSATTRKVFFGIADAVAARVTITLEEGSGGLTSFTKRPMSPGGSA